MDEEDEKRESDIMKLAIKNQIWYGLDDASLKLQAQLAETVKKLTIRPPSPNSSQIKLLPRNPLDSKILKWKSDKKTHVLTLLKSNGRVEHISRDDALGLGATDLQDLLELQLHRDEDDEDSLNFELQSKGKIREKLMRE
ncbi:hypothetical protein HanRHA438_Chr02g0060701 [Helianthus annuus]|nr:hypothetical protein HanRHA438_Chr02g0060701 [Helianthus annuus]